VDECSLSVFGKFRWELGACNTAIAGRMSSLALFVPSDVRSLTRQERRTGSCDEATGSSGR
jgi:hypothetical protein